MKSRKGVTLIALLIRQLKNLFTLIDAQPTWDRKKNKEQTNTMNPSFRCTSDNPLR